MEVKRGENSLRLRRNSGSTSATELVIPPALSQTASTPAGQQAQAGQIGSLQAQQPPPSPPQGAGEILVKSPIVGTYYESPKPGDPPFVKVGDQVEPGQVLCII